MSYEVGNLDSPPNLTEDIMKSVYLRAMNAEEFCQCLEDHGLYSMAVDTMVTMLERQGRNQNETHQLEWDEGGCLTPNYGENPHLPEGYKKQMEEKGWYKTPDAVVVTSDMLVEDLNKQSPPNADSLDDPHGGTGRVDGNVDLRSSGSSGVSHQDFVDDSYDGKGNEGCWDFAQPSSKQEHPQRVHDPAPMPESGIDQIIAEYNNPCKAEGFES